jgi:hypothetical protein
VIRSLPAVACAVPLLLAACGSGGHKTTPPAPPAKCLRAVARLQAEVVDLRKAAARKDVAEVNKLTDRFLNDVALAPIGNLRRNRLIDHAAGALVGTCEQCFQALEAARPIPAIRSGQSAGC